jgi:hypothetical protein
MTAETLATTQPALLPVFALIVWTFVMWVWMFATRIPAMQKAKINPDSLDGKVTLKDLLPARVMNVGDNYNHLHEQPTLFYALAFYLTLAGSADTINAYLLWAYVILRVLHSVVQATFNRITVRFLLFMVSSLCLIAILVREIIRLVA